MISARGQAAGAEKASLRSLAAGHKPQGHNHPPNLQTSARDSACGGHANDDLGAQHPAHRLRGAVGSHRDPARRGPGHHGPARIVIVKVLTPYRVSHGGTAYRPGEIADVPDDVAWQ